MSTEPRLHLDARGRVIVENATAEIMEALAALRWSGAAGPGIRVSASPTRPPAHLPSRVPAHPRTPSEATHRA